MAFVKDSKNIKFNSECVSIQKSDLLGDIKTTFRELVPSLDTCTMLCLMSTVLQRIVHCYWSIIMRLSKNIQKVPPKEQRVEQGQCGEFIKQKLNMKHWRDDSIRKCLPCKHGDLSSIPSVSFSIIFSCTLTSWLEVFSKPTCMLLSKQRDISWTEQSTHLGDLKHVSCFSCNRNSDWHPQDNTI